VDRARKKDELAREQAGLAAAEAKRKKREVSWSALSSSVDKC
jgi:hypothetical protein